MAAKDERDRLMKRLKNFYIRRCPEKAENQELLDSVVERLVEHPEKEETLFLTLLKKYPKDVVKIKRKKKKKKKKEERDGIHEKNEDNVPDILRPHKKSASEKKEKESNQINVHHKLPNGVEYIDTTQGSGEEKARRGDLITVKYKGSLDGEQEHLFDKGTLTFTIGRREVVEGFDCGVVGMRQGLTRRIFIPSRLGYGAKGAPPVIPPNSDLYFEIRLVRIGSRRSQRREEESRKRASAANKHGRSKNKKRRRDNHTSFTPPNSLSSGPIDFGDLSRFD